jgi:ABC-type uncharacterized transport system permease subunit
MVSPNISCAFGTISLETLSCRAARPWNNTVILWSDKPLPFAIAIVIAIAIAIATYWWYRRIGYHHSSQGERQNHADHFFHAIHSSFLL